MEVQQKKIKEMYQELVQKAWESATFKEQLINNPKETISEFSEVRFNEKANIEVEDQTDTNIIYLNIPRSREKLDLDLELTDEQLEQVSGGGEIWATVATVLAIAYFVNDVIDGAGQYIDEQ